MPIRDREERAARTKRRVSARERREEIVRARIADARRRKTRHARGQKVPPSPVAATLARDERGA